MPLHNSVPLCSFNYAGDTLSSATFHYEDGNINKEVNKAIYVDKNIIQIDKYQNLLLHNQTQVINKDSNKLLKRSVNLISISNTKLLQTKDFLINKCNSVGLKTSSLNISMEFDKNLELREKEILIKFSQGLEKREKELGIQFSKELNTSSPHIHIDFSKELEAKESELSIELDKELEINNPNSMIINSNMELERNSDLSIIKNLSLGLKKDIHSITQYQSKHINLSESKPINIKTKSYFFYKSKFININKTYFPKYMYRFKNGALNLINTYYLKLNQRVLNKYREITVKSEEIKLFIEKGCKSLLPFIKSLDKNINGYLEKEECFSLYKDESGNYLGKLNSINLEKDNSKNYLENLTCKNMSKDDSNKYFYRKALNNINYHIDNRYLYKLGLINVAKDKSSKHFYRIDRHTLFKNELKTQLDRVALFHLYKNVEKYSNRVFTTHIYKEYGKYTDRIYDLNLYRQEEFSLLGFRILPIYQDNCKYLKDNIITSITKEKGTSFIDVIERWWWLNSTNPKDNLIVPNKDYSSMSDLLNNTQFEYLRYTNHPIEWGKDWGKDWNIPPYAVSIEIMLDLVNILIMVWHKNVQGWLCCTGKEGIQLLMELLFDWYSMNNSKTNQSYYRVYRWIRWEAEKVYFLDTTSGLQAIGILISNLLDYMRIHHFNVVPLWKNPKAMDSERNFNKSADNGDLMKEVDKIKGNRHYPIETQNFEKIDIFRR